MLLIASVVNEGGDRVRIGSSLTSRAPEPAKVWSVWLALVRSAGFSAIFAAECQPLPNFLPPSLIDTRFCDHSARSGPGCGRFAANGRLASTPVGRGHTVRVDRCFAVECLHGSARKTVSARSPTVVGRVPRVQERSVCGACRNAVASLECIRAGAVAHV